MSDYEHHSTNQILSVGIMSANLMTLGSELYVLEECGVQLLHFDVMDGMFAPSITIGAPFIKAVQTSMYKDVHLMVENPLDKIEDFVAAGADAITLHVESSKHIHRALQMIGQMQNVNDAERGIVRGIALNPGTPVSVIEPLLDEVEIVFLVGVNPGFPKQSFIEMTKRKYESLVSLLESTGKGTLIGIDGGVTRANIGEIASLGADFIVTGSAVFENGAIRENLKEMMSCLSSPNSSSGE